MDTWAGAGGRFACIFATAACLALLATNPLRAQEPPTDTPPPPCVVGAEVSGVINGATAAHLERAITVATKERCAAVMVTLDTPGGLMDAMRDVVRQFLGAPLPVIVHVAPSGARAGSAGMFITIAAHVAAMAPGSNIGAAHPVLVGAGNGEQASETVRKAENDAAALARAIATERQRNAEWAEDAVRDSSSLTASEALEHGVIDLVVASPTELLEELDGWSVSVQGTSPQRLHTRGARIIPQGMTIQQRVLHLLGDPNVTYLLFLLGMLGLMIELYSPGVLVPGALGLLFLLLAAVGMNLLPINLGGALLLVVAVALFIGELYTSTTGLLTLAGVLCLVGGAALLLDRDDPNFFADASVRLSWSVVLPLALLAAITSGLLAWQVRRSARAGPRTGREALIGAPGTAATHIDAEGGTALVHGERWRAISDGPIEPGAHLLVIGVERLTVQVTLAPPSNFPAAAPPQPRHSKGT